MSPLTVREVTDLGGRRAAWDDLVLHAAVPTPFLRSWWLEAVAPPAVSRYLLVLEGDLLVGGLPVERTRRAGVVQWRFLGQGKLCPDHLDLLAAPGRAPDVAAALRHHLTSPRAWVVDLEGLHEASALLAAWPELEVDEVDRAPYTPLAGSYDDYLASRSKNSRRRFGKIWRRVHEEGFTIRRVEDTDLESGLRAFARLNVERGDRAELLAELPRIERAVRAGVARGEVRVFVGETDGIPGAAALIFTTGGRASNYQTVRSLDPVFTNAGNVADLAVIRDACETGLVEFDLLRGDEPYKRHFVSEDRQVLRARASGGAGGRTMHAADLLRERSRRRVGAWAKKVRTPVDQTAPAPH